MASAAWGSFNPLAIVKGYQAGEAWAWDDANSEEKLKAAKIANEFNQGRIGSQKIADAIEQKRLESLGLSNQFDQGKLAAQQEVWAQAGKAKERQDIANAVPRFEADGVTPRDQRVIAADITAALNAAGHGASAFENDTQSKIAQRLQAIQAGNVQAAQRLNEMVNPYAIGAQAPQGLTRAQQLSWSLNALPVLQSQDAGSAEGAKDAREFSQKIALEGFKNQADNKLPAKVQEAAIEAAIKAKAESAAANQSLAQQQIAGDNAYREVLRIASLKPEPIGTQINNAISPNAMGGGATVPSVLNKSAVTPGVNPSNMGGSTPLAAALAPPVASQPVPASAMLAQSLNSPVITDDPIAAKNTAIQAKNIEAEPIRGLIRAMQRDLAQATSLNGRQYAAPDVIQKIKQKLSQAQNELAIKDAELAAIYRTPYSKPMSATPQWAQDLNSKYK